MMNKASFYQSMSGFIGHRVSDRFSGKRLGFYEDR